MTESPGASRRLVVLAVYPWAEFWSMGEGRGAPSFYLSVTSFPRRGHEMHVVMPGPPGGPAEEEMDGVRLHRFRTRVNFYPEIGGGRLLRHAAILFSYLWWFVRAVPFARRLAARIRPDVVIGMGSLGAPVARRVALDIGVPNITRLFGTELQAVAGDRLRTALRYRDTAAYRTPATYMIVCNDGSGSDEVARRLGVDMSRFRFWYNGVDKARYASADRARGRERLGIGADVPLVLSVSRLHGEKRVDRLVRAAMDVLARRPDVMFVVVGEGEEGPRLRALARDLGIGDRVLFTGSFPRGELPDIYAAADVFVTLSDRTNVLNPLHEAMISGLAVVALDTGGTSQVIEDGVSGLLVAPSDAGTAGEVILDLLSDEGKRRALGLAARASADRRLPTYEERQDMEVDIVEQAVREHGRDDS